MKTLCLVVLALIGCAAPAIRGNFRNQLETPRVGSAHIGEITAGELDEAARILLEAPDVAAFVIDSPGGSVRVGLAFIKLMRQAQDRGTLIHCTIPAGGMAASMAAVIFEQCDNRLIVHGGALMFHTISVGSAGGNQWEVERLAREMASWNKRLAILASAKLHITLAEYEAKVADNDWWLGWEEAIAIGAADIHGQ